MSDHGLKIHWFHILLALSDRALHGTAIMEAALDRTDGEFRLWPGMLYGSLKDLAHAGLITEVEPPVDAPTEGGRRRFYAITREGKAALEAEVERLSDLVRAARARGVGPRPERA